ncbi:MAG: DmsE family decaheme c-type cytochrome [Acidobacteriia bacterium]|nr:DmsE family decaheme c-type cytochrome [Terriglobia bacterium]
MTAFSWLPPRVSKGPRARRFHAARLAAFLSAAALFSVLAGHSQDKPPAQAPAQNQPPAQAQAAAPAENKPAEYVGSDTCQGCHEDIFKAFEKNPHHLVETSKKYKFDTKACESCHGPGSKHAESMSAADIQNPAKLKPDQTDRICLKCHLNQPTHVGRINSSHAKNEVSCVACHSIHKNGPEGLVPRTMAATNQLCAGCHTDIWASFQQPFRHRLPEGAMSCVDCHNPHGSFLPRAMQTAFRGNEPGCLKCHGNLAGPFTFEHAPVRLDGCTACHMPHGSTNPRMLTRQQVRFVCLECHSNLPVPNPAPNSPLGGVPPAFHDIRSPRFQNCTLCHQKVHGSYVDRGLLR